MASNALNLGEECPRNAPRLRFLMVLIQRFMLYSWLQAGQEKPGLGHSHLPLLMKHPSNAFAVFLTS
jgi:hypothetical protein